MTKQRKEILKKDRWNVEALYPTLKAWETEFAKIEGKKTKAPFFPTLLKYNKKLVSAKAIKELFTTYFSIERKLRKLYTYAHLRHDEDIINDTYKKAYDRISTLYHQFEEESSWIQPQIQSVSKKILQSPDLKEYAFFIEKLLRLTPYTLPESEEKLLALAGQALTTSQRTFSAISDADFKFGTVKDKAGKEMPLTHGSYGMYLRSPDRTLRKNAFTQFTGKYAEFENSLGELINGKMQDHLFNAKARNYSSCLEASLFPKNIDTSVYHALIKAVHDNISALHDYMKLRKKALKLKEMHLYDVYVPFVKSVDMKFSYEQAEELVIESVAPLGSEYQKLLKNGLQKDRWVDRYENQNKRSGAYSSGCYDSSPYILMNYKGILRDVFTLAHEAGHSMHSLLSRTYQPYQYSDYVIFVAEVASTFNEELLMQLMLKNASSKQEKAFLLNEKLEDMRATLFRQAMFAEFELFMHETVEKRIPITPALLKAEYLRLNAFYFGKDVVVDPEIAIEWARIPHFYYNFYVY
ncbi:MAG: yjbG, partial [Chlamydiia bacterium]|nr:yjbG [Chlamydiia bacterium]